MKSADVLSLSNFGLVCSHFVGNNCITWEWPLPSPPAFWLTFCTESQVMCVTVGSGEAFLRLALMINLLSFKKTHTPPCVLSWNLFTLSLVPVSCTWAVSPPSLFVSGFSRVDRNAQCVLTGAPEGLVSSVAICSWGITASWKCCRTTTVNFCKIR